MFEKLEKQSVLEKKALPYPKIPCVYVHNKEFFCIKHPGKKHMNLGAIKQHIRGKDHRLDWETGEPLDRKSSASLIEEIEYSNKLAKFEARKAEFMELKYKLDEIIPPENHLLKRFYLAEYGLEGDLKEEVIFYLKSKIIERYNSK